MTLTQAQRDCALLTTLGEDVLVLHRMTGVEHLGRLFEYKIDALSENHNIKAEDLLGKKASVRVNIVDEGRVRYFNGHIVHFSYVGELYHFACYRMTLRPWLWLLDQRTDCRIFQNKNIMDIMSGLFKENDFDDFEYRLSEDYPENSYWVQYRESILNFFSRRTENDGIYYYFSHESDKHKLILADSLSAHDFVKGYEELPYMTQTVGGSELVKECILDWRVTKAVRPGTFTLAAFDHLRPKADLQVRRADPRAHDFSGFEAYDYCYHYVDRAQGERYARVRMEEAHSEFERAYGRTNARGLGAGDLFRMVDYPREDQNRWYLIVSASYDIKSDDYFAFNEVEPTEPFLCDLTAIDSRQSYRPPRVTSRPVIEGPQTAIVVGQASEEIWTNENACVKLHFHWDCRDNRDENSSCWVRVAQNWAGRGWGGLAVPRIGQEVIVHFLEGDPDKPIVSGRVYNGDCLPPYDLPGQAVVSGLKSNSTPGGGGYNEIAMDDTKGNELLRVHGQYDMDTTIENDLREHVLNNRSRDVAVDETISVGNDQTSTVGSNQTYTVGKNQSRTVGADKTTTVGVNHSETIGSNMTVNVGSNLTETVKVNYAETVGVAMALTVGATMAQSVGATLEQTVGLSKTEKVGTDKSVSIGKNKSEDVGGAKTVSVSKDLRETISGEHNESVTKSYALSAKSVRITAEDEISLNTGKATIVMKKNGDIQIEGKKLTIKGTGDVIVKGKKVLEN